MNKIIIRSIILIMLLTTIKTYSGDNSKNKEDSYKFISSIVEQFKDMYKAVPINASNSDDIEIKHSSDFNMKQIIPAEAIGNYPNHLKIIFQKKLKHYHLVVYEDNKLIQSWLINLENKNQDYYINYDSKGKINNISAYDNVNNKRIWIFFDENDKIIQANFYINTTNNMEQMDGTLSKIEKYNNESLLQTFEKDITVPIIPRIDNITFSGGNGSSIKDAISIGGTKDNIVGVTMEYQYLNDVYGPKGIEWNITSQNLVKENNRFYDKLELLMKDKKIIIIYFDITGFYCK